MIEIHLLAPSDADLDEIESMKSDDFKVISAWMHHGGPKNVKYLCRIETTEEMFLFLLLKYGRESVWKR